MFAGNVYPVINNIGHDLELAHKRELGHNHSDCQCSFRAKPARIPGERHNIFVVLMIASVRNEWGSPVTNAMRDKKAGEVGHELIEFIKNRMGLTEDPIWHGAFDSEARERDPASSEEES